MRKNVIHNAMELVNPTDEQKARMREGILARLPEEKKPVRRTYQAKQAPERRWSWIPTAAALFAVVLIGVFVLGKPGTGRVEFAAPKFTSRSVQDFFESAPYRASLEWNAYLKTCEESTEGLAGPYPDYGCSSAEMMEKLDALCETYGLSLEEQCTAINDYDRLMEILCMDTIFRPMEGVSRNFTDYGNCYYSDGSFEVGGETVMQYDGSPWVYPITFSFYRLMKTTFYDVFLDIGDITQYEYWEYTTQSGVELLLALQQDQTLILADRGDSVILVFTIYDRYANTEYRELSLDRAALEAFAETFDYTLPPDGGLVPVPDPAAIAAEQLMVYSTPSPESTAIGTIEKGTLLTLVNREIVNGKAWGLVNGENAGYPSGWVEMENVGLTYTTKPSAEETASAENGAIPQAYGDVLEKYVTAVNERWGGERCSQEDISIILRDIESLDSLGYALLDLDVNGVEELILACDDESQTVLDLYTLVDGELVHVLSGWERNSYFLRDGNLIFNIGTESGSCTNYVFSHLSGGELIQEEVVRFDTLRDMENPWFMGADLHPVTQEEAEAAISAHTRDRIQLMPLSQMQ